MTRHQKRMLKQAAKQICLHILFIVICFVTLIPILYALSVSLNADNSLPFYPEELHAAKLCCGLYRRTCHAVV